MGGPVSNGQRWHRGLRAGASGVSVREAGQLSPLSLHRSLAFPPHPRRATVAGRAPLGFPLLGYSRGHWLLASVFAQKPPFGEITSRVRTDPAVSCLESQATQRETVNFILGVTPLRICTRGYRVPGAPTSVYASPPSARASRLPGPGAGTNQTHLLPPASPSQSCQGCRLAWETTRSWVLTRGDDA